MATSNVLKVQTGVFRILHRRAALPMPVLAAIHDVQVVKQLNVPSMFSFTLSAQSERGAWQGVDLDTFKPGDEISVFLGLDSPQELVTGNVTAIEPSFAEYSTVTIRGFDRMFRLRFGSHTRTFLDLPENEMVSQVARSAGLEVQPMGSPGTVNDYVMQNNQTNYAFLLQRCQLLNHELLMKGTTLVFRPAAEGGSPVRTLNYPRDLQRVALNLKVPTQGEQVTVTGYDIETNQYISVASSGGTPADLMGGRVTGYQEAADFPSSAIALERPDLNTAEALQEVAEAQYQRNLSSFIEGNASIQGDPQLIAGINIKLTGVSERFNGLYYITEATHRYDDDKGYQTDIKLRRTGV
jgi:uncharacterized protein